MSISSGVRCRDVLRKGVNRFAGGFICSAAEHDAHQIVTDHTRAALVERLVEALRNVPLLVEAAKGIRNVHTWKGSKNYEAALGDAVAELNSALETVDLTTVYELLNDAKGGPR